MNRRLVQGGGSVLALVSAAALWAAESPQWAARMESLRSVLAQVMVLAGPEASGYDESSNKELEQDARTLSSLAHGLGHGALKAPDSDPGLQVVAAMFASEASRAASELERGHVEYAKSMLRSIGGYCIACHTRGGGPSVSLPSLEPKGFAAWAPFDQARFLAATRQFDRAFGLFGKIMSERDVSESKLIEWQRAVQYGLAIAVRVKNDPDAALAIVERVLRNPSAPEFMREDARQWKASILRWKAELPHRATSEAGLLAEAERLVALARKTQQFPADHAADIIYLRASAVAAELLRRYPTGRGSAEALYVDGLSNEALRDLGLWELHDVYYEACMHRAPHTRVAMSCYRQYEQDVYLGFTGSEGTSLPDDVRSRLAELRKLAAPAAKSGEMPKEDL